MELELLLMHCNLNSTLSFANWNTKPIDQLKLILG